MKTKIVYVVVSNDNDIYLEQAYVSMYSVKYYMPDAHITLLTDKLTEATFIGIRKKEIQYVDELISVEVSNDYTASQRSRILKASVRKYIKGDFLFIDTDTIVVKPLYEIDNMEADIAACWDTHSPFVSNPYRSMCIEHGRRLGWPIEKELIYYNSGVIFVKDNGRSHKFYELWHKNWLEGCRKKVYMDQPAFAKTNYMLGHPIQTLNDIWNCELKHGIRYLKDAKIVHYLGVDLFTEAINHQQLFILNEKRILETIKKNSEIPPTIKDVIIDPFKGIAQITHTFSGCYLNYFHSCLFVYTCKYSDSFVLKLAEWMLRFCIKLWKYLH